MAGSVATRCLHFPAPTSGINNCMKSLSLRFGQPLCQACIKQDPVHVLPRFCAGPAKVAMQQRRLSVFGNVGKSGNAYQISRYRFVVDDTAFSRDPTLAASINKSEVLQQTEMMSELYFIQQLNHDPAGISVRARHRHDA